MLTMIRINGMEKRIQELYSMKRIQKPADITLIVFDEWLRIHTIYRSGETNNLEFRDTFRVFMDGSKTLLTRRIEMAHEIGHMLLHSGNQVFMTSIMRSKQEWQANRFAMYALIPSLMLIQSIGEKACDAVCIADLALEYGVTSKFMVERLKLLKEDMEI